MVGGIERAAEVKICKGCFNLWRGLAGLAGVSCKVFIESSLIILLIPIVQPASAVERL